MMGFLFISPPLAAVTKSLESSLQFCDTVIVLTFTAHGLTNTFFPTEGSHLFWARLRFRRGFAAALLARSEFRMLIRCILHSLQCCSLQLEACNRSFCFVSAHLHPQLQLPWQPCARCLRTSAVCTTPPRSKTCSNSCSR